jgi:hypothetical protein
MDENRLEGRTARIGTIPATGDVETQRRGMAEQVAGAAQDAYLDQWLRDRIENKPYTSALVALGIGWLLGRMHLPS